MIELRGYRIDPDAGVVYGIRGRPVGSLDSSGYLQIDGRSRGLGMLSAHRLVWEAAHGPIPDGYEVNHINGVKSDNRIANLELVTHAENIRHAYRTGLKSNAGERHPGAKLNVHSVEAIRRRYPAEPAKALAVEFGISPRQVRSVADGTSWKEAA